MDNRNSFNIVSLVFSIIIMYGMYTVLLSDELFPLSIRTMQHSMNQWAKHWHILAVGLLPIYVACVFFGTVLCSVLCGSILQRWLSYFTQQK